MSSVKQLDDALARVVDALRASALAGTQGAAALILEAAKQRVPVHLGTVRDHLGVVSHQTNSGAKSSVQVADSGPGGVAHEAVFLEFGTSKMAARPFMRPAAALTHDAALALLTQTIQTTLKAHE